MKDIFLWLHIPTGKERGCWRPDQLSEVFGVFEGVDLHYTDGCSDREHLACSDMPHLYQMWDALFFPSGGEGFGLPAWEAMACGIPIVYTNHSSHGEFIGAAGAGIPIGGILQPAPGDGILRLVANVEEAVAAVRRIHDNRHLGCSLGENGRRYVQAFSPSKMAVLWDALFTRIVGERVG